MANINILEKSFEIIDTKEKMTVPDCFVVGPNKIGDGHGEAKFYVGNENIATRNFFGKNSFEIKCFILKNDLLSYLKDCEVEYSNPEQQYKKKEEMKALWKERLEKITNLPEILYFQLKEQSQISGPRIYVNSADGPYELIREISLPNISYLSAIKLKDQNNEIVYYFRLFIDYFDSSYEHPYTIKKEELEINQNDSIGVEEKEEIIKARKGQGKYRRDLLEECPFCPITSISDDRLLIASHIKPWVSSSDVEKIDPKNGFMLTPTYDLLFDRGFISFTDDKKILISPWLSNMTCSKLNIAPNKKYNTLPIEGRESYLEYHRENIFKD